MRACLTAAVAENNTFFSAGLILLVSLLFSSKDASATKNAITASTTIGTSREGTSDDNENNDFTGGLHHGLDCFDYDDCVWCFLCVSDKIKSNL